MRQILARPSPLKIKQNKKTLGRFLWLIVLLAILFVGLGLLSHLPKLVIDNVSVEGEGLVDFVAIKQKTLEYLSGNQALLYARGNIFLYSKSEITDFVQREFPRVSAITEIKRDGRKLSLWVEERQSAYLWCGYERPIYENRFKDADCFFVDERGFIFVNAPFFTNGVYITFYGGVTKDADPVGQTLRLQNSMKDFDDLVATLEDGGTKIHSIIVNADGQHELLLDIHTATGDFAKIIFNEEESFVVLREKLHTALTSPEFLDEFELKKDSLEYIDTRFKNRVFYKFQDGK